MLSQPLPPQQPKAGEVISVLNGLTARKVIQENMARQLAAGTDRDGLFRLMSAAAKSERLVAEDILREAGYMLPQSNRTHALLQELIANPPAPDFPAETAQKLLSLIPNNERSFP